MDKVTPEQTNQVNHKVENQPSVNTTNLNNQPALQPTNSAQQIQSDEELARRLQAEYIAEFERERQRRLIQEYQRRLILDAQRRIIEQQILQAILSRALQNQQNPQQSSQPQTSQQAPQPQTSQQSSSQPQNTQVPQQPVQQSPQPQQQNGQQQNQETQQSNMEGVTYIHTQQPILIIQNGDSDPVILSQPVLFHFHFNVFDNEMSYEDLLRLQERLGNVNRGASQDDINKYTQAFKAVEIPKEGNCVICQSEFQKDEELRSLPCKHSYHKDCVDQWLKINKTCPICKKDITEVKN